jgi:hypothetical protein
MSDTVPRAVDEHLLRALRSRRDSGEAVRRGGGVLVLVIIEHHEECEQRFLFEKEASDVVRAHERFHQPTWLRQPTYKDARGHTLGCGLREAP